MNLYYLKGLTSVGVKSLQTGEIVSSTLQKKEQFTASKGVVGSHHSKDRQYNGQMKKDQNTNVGRQNTTQKTKD